MPSDPRTAGQSGCGLRRNTPAARYFALHLALALASFASGRAAMADQTPSVLVTVTKLRAGSLPLTVRAFGTVEADPSVRQAVMAPAAATVARVFVRVGEEVARAAPLIQLAPNPQTHADYAKAVSALRTADAQVRHTEELLSQHLATRQQLVDAQQTQTDAGVALHALELQGAAGPKTLTAPFKAAITKIDVSTGTLVSEGTALLELAPPNSLVLKVGVVPADATAIGRGDRAVVEPLGRDRRIAASVVLRGAVVDPGNGLVPVEIALPPNALLPGESANATIATSSVRGFVVPHAAILINDSGHPYVVQVVAGAAKLVPVKILDSQGKKDVIEGKLDAAAPLVLSGGRQLDEGMKVRFSHSWRQAP